MEATAIHTLIRQRPPTPLCRGLNPYCGENSEPGRYIKESLTSSPELENSQGHSRQQKWSNPYQRIRSPAVTAWLSVPPPTWPSYRA